MATTTRKGLADNERNTDSEINSDTVEDVELRMGETRKKQQHKVMNSQKIRKRTVTISGSSESNLDFTKCNSPPQKVLKTAHEPIATQPSCSCKDEINSLKNYINEIMEKNCKSLSIQLSQLGSQVVDVKAALKELFKKPTTSNSIDSCDVISPFNDIWKRLPCQTVEEFQKFDERIGKEVDFRQKLAQKLISIVNKRTTIVRNMGEIMRFCLSRQVALKCNPVKTVEGKLFVFRNTNLYNVIKAALLSALSNDENPLKDSDIIKVVATVLHHCRDWEGGRVKRQKKTVNIENTNEDTDSRLVEIDQSQDKNLELDQSQDENFVFNL